MINVYMIQDMIGAGTDTAFFVLDTAMAELMRRPELMAKLEAEVRNETPDGQHMVEEEDLSLQYCTT
jgi:cytochrome P450